MLPIDAKIVDGSRTCEEIVISRLSDVVFFYYDRYLANKAGKKALGKLVKVVASYVRQLVRIEELQQRLDSSAIIDSDAPPRYGTDYLSDVVKAGRNEELVKKFNVLDETDASTAVVSAKTKENSATPCSTHMRKASIKEKSKILEKLNNMKGAIASFEDDISRYIKIELKNGTFPSKFVDKDGNIRISNRLVLLSDTLNIPTTTNILHNKTTPSTTQSNSNDKINSHLDTPESSTVAIAGITLECPVPSQSSTDTSIVISQDNNKQFIPIQPASNYNQSNDPTSSDISQHTTPTSIKPKLTKRKFIPAIISRLSNVKSTGDSISTFKPNPDENSQIQIKFSSNQDTEQHISFQNNPTTASNENNYHFSNNTENPLTKIEIKNDPSINSRRKDNKSKSQSLFASQNNSDDDLLIINPLAPIPPKKHQKSKVLKSTNETFTGAKKRSRDEATLLSDTPAPLKQNKTSIGTPPNNLPKDTECKIISQDVIDFLKTAKLKKLQSSSESEVETEPSQLETYPPKTNQDPQSSTKIQTTTTTVPPSSISNKKSTITEQQSKSPPQQSKDPNHYQRRLAEHKKKQAAIIEELSKKLQDVIHDNIQQPINQLYSAFISVAYEGAKALKLVYHAPSGRPSDTAKQTNSTSNDTPISPESNKNTPSQDKQISNSQTSANNNKDNDLPANTNTTKRLRAIFRTNQKRCFREITEAKPKWCEASAESITNTLSNQSIVNQEEPVIVENTTQSLPITVSSPSQLPNKNDNNNVTPKNPQIQTNCNMTEESQITNTQNDNYSQKALYETGQRFSDFYIAVEEVASSLERAKKDTSPGPDGIQMAFWKKMPSMEFLLSPIFNKILQEGKVPDDWLVSRLVLIPKSINPNVNNPLDYRPISITQTIYRLFMGVLSRKLSSLIQLSPSQKGFVLGDGCVEHAFVLQEILDQVRRKRRPLSAVWIDLRKAFDSVPHAAIFKQLNHHGVPQLLIQLLQEMYSNCHNIITDKDGNTSLLHQYGRGVRQGCPLSPLLFNLVIDLFLQDVDSSNLGYNLHGKKFGSLAFADDVVLLAPSNEQMEGLIKLFDKFATEHGLEVNHSKCASLQVRYKNSKRIINDPEAPIFSLSGNVIPQLEDFYRYLGTCKDLSSFKELPECFPKFQENLQKISQSPILHFMKIALVKTYLTPTLDYSMKTNILKIEDLKKVDRDIKSKVRQWLNIPESTTKSLLYVPPSSGGLGLRNLQKDFTALRLAAALNVIHSKDIRIQELAFDSIREVVGRRTNNSMAPVDYFNRDQELLVHRDVRSLISSIRINTKSLGLQLKQIDEENFSLVDLDHEYLLQPSLPEYQKRGATRIRRLRWHYQCQFLEQWESQCIQGRSVGCFVGSTVANSWITHGDVSPYVYRFGLLGRVNALPTKCVLQQRRLTPDALCRRCNRATEHLGHILGGCVHGERMRSARHNHVQELICEQIKLKKDWVLLQNSKIPIISSPRRPDIVLLNRKAKQAIICDVSVSFESSPHRLEHVLEHKRRKYVDERTQLLNLGYSCSLHALIYGSLGAHHPTNNDTYKDIQISNKRKTKYLQKSITRQLLSDSAMIWRNHVIGTRTTGNSTSRVSRSNPTTQPSQQPFQKPATQ